MPHTQIAKNKPVGMKLPTAGTKRRTLWDRIKSIANDIRSYPAAYSMMLPGILYVFIFSYCTYPYLFAAFQNYKTRLGLFKSPFVGLDNFKLIFANSTIWRVILNTIVLNAMSIASVTIVALTIAILLNEIRGKLFPKITVSILLFPKFLSWPVVSYILYALLGTTSGLINNAIISMGGDAVNWYSTASYWPFILTFMKTWKMAGMKTIIFTSALSAIDPGIYEAAKIDGAGKWQTIRRVTLPMLMPQVVMLALMDVGKIFHGDFGMIYALVGDNGMLFKTTDVIDTYVFRIFRTYGNISQSIAVGLVQAVFGFIMVYTMNKIVRKHFSEGALF